MSTNLKRKLNEEKQEVVAEKINKRELNLEEKISKLVDAVVTQGPYGRFVITTPTTETSPYVTLQNAVSYMNLTLTVSKSESEINSFVLHVSGQEFAKGRFSNIQDARKGLAEQALNKLKETCFFITRKSDFVNVTKGNLHETEALSETVQTPASSDSTAYKIMAKMGWSGGGLGAQEQGNCDAITIYENVNRQGLGTSNLTKQITEKLESFAKSSSSLTLVFDSDFTKEERVFIHKAARKFNLKTKSIGGENRKITVSKNVNKMDIVKQLLRTGGEDGFYKLHIPTNFEHLWQF
ncbi:NF-kappa-B-repressing factor-like [Tribolium madens]|uniref:NF-kappa-B-repressing factor-like n=1 Tax=Tribolium madens TaxID=41895 RepID=UPI001CF7280D|nr:NF-kappa-B-repressing factor-like [Tribolium madens]